MNTGNKRNLHRLFGQSTTEYAVLVAIVAAALLAMQVYIKRGLQGRIRNMADQISPNRQYESLKTNSEYTTQQTGQTTQQYIGGGKYQTTTMDQTTKTGTENTDLTENSQAGK